MSTEESGRPAAELLPLDDVREVVLSHVSRLPRERVALSAAHGRVLREDLYVREPVPPFDNSAMDGYAVRSSDLAGASQASPVTVPVQGELPAGVTGDALRPGHAIRIMTGAPIPPGAEAVVPHELTRHSDREVTFFSEAVAGQNVRLAGGDMRPGDIPLACGELLRAPQIGVAATLGYAELLVTKVPRVAILCPGDELVDVGVKPGPGQIRNSNAYALAGMVLESGAEPVSLGTVPDDRERILDAIRNAVGSGVDAIVSTGGVSAGDYDFVKDVTRSFARPGYVFKVAMKPGKPQAFGLFEGCPLFGLPGNPAASIVSFEVLVRPAIRKMRGEARILPRMFGVRFPFEYRYKAGRVFFLRARLEPDSDGEEGEGAAVVRPGFRVARPGPQDSSFLGSLARANAIVVLEASQDRVAPGEVRPAFWLGGTQWTV